MGLLSTTRFILSHPANEGRRMAALLRFARWQLGSRILGMPAAAPFTDHAKLLVTPGMTGATGNIYCGLHEFDDMLFAAHFLRPDELFVDVGANIGSYTILASVAAKARVVSLEPVPTTFRHLASNVALNGVSDRVRCENVAAGRSPGTVRFMSGRDTMNRVLGEAETDRTEISVPQRLLDDVLTGLPIPSLIKIDVEGSEAEVLAGATRTFGSSSLKAAIIETDGTALVEPQPRRTVADFMRERGFVECRYVAQNRVLAPVAAGARSANRIFVREVDTAERRVRGASQVFLYGRGY